MILLYSIRKTKWSPAYSEGSTPALGTFRCDAAIGTGPVLKTGDPLKRAGGSRLSHSAYTISADMQTD